ncbi:MAG: DUF4194 domain-containing protein [Pirellulales bacterium]
MPQAVQPEFREWSIAAVRLLQGVVYSDDESVWNTILSSQSQLESYLARLGVFLIVDESEGMAYVRQADPDELPEGYERVPKLFRKSRLGYWVTLLCVLLREELRRFEEEDINNERCVIEINSLFDHWRAFFPMSYDEVRQRRELDASLAKLCDLGFVRKFNSECESWEIRRILKARLPVSELESLKSQLLAASARRSELETQVKSS